ncbi:DMT family transporter [Candidatus Peregrinibacteria bacterium]|nr:DMT family transporter [Candidatus Peregrinibacteria bacterium]
MDVSLRKRLFSWHRERPRVLTIGWIALIANVVVSASYTIFAKLLTDGFSPLSLIFISESLTIFFTLFVFGAVPTVRQLVRVPPSSVLPLVSIGVTNGIVAPLLLFIGLRYTSAVNATLLSNAEMVFLFLLAFLFLRERCTFAHLLSLLTIVGGILIVSLQGFASGLRLQSGDILILLACLSFSTGSIVFRRFLSAIDPQLVVLVRSILPVCTFFLLAPFIDVPFIRELRMMPLALLPVLLGFGFLSRFMNTFTFYEAMERLPVSTISIVSNLAVVVGMFFARVGLGEPILPYHLIGGAAIIIGSLLLEVLGVHPTEEHLESHLIQKKS